MTEPKHLNYHIGDLTPIIGIFRYSNRCNRYAKNSHNQTSESEQLYGQVRTTLLGLYNIPFVTAISIGIVKGLEKLIN